MSEPKISSTATPITTTELPSTSSTTTSTTTIPTTTATTVTTSNSFKKGHYSRPSEELAHHARLAHSSSRARKVIPSDKIDDLDNILGSYHHEGPFDATLASRQVPGRAPLDAVKYTNSLALACTPQEAIERSIRRHEPLSATGESGVVAQVGYSAREGVTSEGLEHVGDLPPRVDDDQDEDDGADEGIELDGMRPVKAKKGFVEYHSSLDRGSDEEDGGLDSLDLGESSSASHSVLSNLKKRLSVKRH